MSGDTIHAACCTDCLILIANGDTSGTARCETPEGEAAYLAEVARRTEGYHVAPSSWPYPPTLVGNTGEGFTIPDDGGAYETDDDGDVWRIDWTDEDRYYGSDREGSFSWSACDVCGETLGGDRYPVAMWAVS